MTLWPLFRFFSHLYRRWFSDTSRLDDWHCYHQNFRWRSCHNRIWKLVWTANQHSTHYIIHGQKQNIIFTESTPIEKRWQSNFQTLLDSSSSWASPPFRLLWPSLGSHICSVNTASAAICARIRLSMTSTTSMEPMQGERNHIIRDIFQGLGRWGRIWGRRQGLCYRLKWLLWRVINFYYQVPCLTINKQSLVSCIVFVQIITDSVAQL